jgi:putative FmdB family regulatory protein
MPLYEYTCDQCQCDFEQLVTGDRKPECPKCHGTRLTKKLSVISAPASGQTASPAVCDPLPGGG